MRVVVLQPSYLPWLGYFDQMRRADLFVYYDDVQYDRDGWLNRNRIRTREGWQWLTVPVKLTGSFGSLISEVEIDNRSGWARKHVMSLEQSYARAPFIETYLPGIRSLLEKPWSRLVDLNLALTAELADMLSLKTKSARSSALRATGSRTERLVAICEELGADRYLSGDAARAYLDESLFERAGIAVEYHSYRHPSYKQVHGEFLPYLSVIDLLANCGPASLEILKGDNP